MECEPEQKNEITKADMRCQFEDNNLKPSTVHENGVGPDNALRDISRTLLILAPICLSNQEEDIGDMYFSSSSDGVTEPSDKRRHKA